jgi:hypothetical protein
MSDIIFSKEFVNIVTLANYKFFIAFLTSFFILKIFSFFYSNDKYFQKIYFQCGFLFSVLYFFVNTSLSQWASSTHYKPIFLVSNVKSLIEKKGFILTSNNFNDQLAFLVFSNPVQFFSGMIIPTLLVFLLGVYCFYRPYPKWTIKNGIYIVDKNIPLIVDCTIIRLLVWNLFLHTVLTILTIVVFDMLFIISEIQHYTRQNSMKNFLADAAPDFRTIVAAVLAPSFVAWSVGSLMKIRYRMNKGDLENYRQERLAKLVLRARRAARHEYPKTEQSLEEFS